MMTGHCLLYLMALPLFIVGVSLTAASTKPQEMVFVPAGPFEAGEPAELGGYGEGDSNEWVSVGDSKLFLPSFWIDKFEVSNEKYAQFAKTKGNRQSGYAKDKRFNAPDQPVVGVTQADAAAYCRFMSKRLPTEMEWEKAAKGPKFRRYPWGDKQPSAKYQIANLKIDDDYAVDGFTFTAPIGNFPKNKSFYGAYDMAGNVWEWTASTYVGDIRSVIKQTANTQIEGRYVTIRGGSWANSAWSARATSRFPWRPHEAGPTIGFRCVKD